MSETCLNHQSWCLRVSVGAEFFLFSEEFAANCKKIVRDRAGAGQPGLGSRDWAEGGGQTQVRLRALTAEARTNCFQH